MSSDNDFPTDDSSDSNSISIFTDERYAMELRAEILRTVSASNEVRRGVSDRLEIGRAGGKDDPSVDTVAGTETVHIGGDLSESAWDARTNVARHIETTVHGRLAVDCIADTTLLGGAMAETHLAGSFLAAGMSDDLIVGPGIRATAPCDLWLAGLIGMEEKVGTAAFDGTLVELYGVAMEREFGVGMHVAGVVSFGGTLYTTMASGFRPLFKVQMGVRNLTPGAGAGSGGSGGSASAPAAPAPGTPGDARMLTAGAGDGFDESANLADLGRAAETTESLSEAENATSTRQIDTAAVLEDTQTLARATEDGEVSEDAAQAMRRLEEAGGVSQTGEDAGDARAAIMVEGEDGIRRMQMTDGSEFDDGDWMKFLTDPVTEGEDSRQAESMADIEDSRHADSGDLAADAEDARHAGSGDLAADAEDTRHADLGDLAPMEDMADGDGASQGKKRAPLGYDGPPGAMDRSQDDQKTMEELWETLIYNRDAVDQYSQHEVELGANPVGLNQEAHTRLQVTRQNLVTFAQDIMAQHIVDAGFNADEVAKWDSAGRVINEDHWDILKHFRTRDEFINIIEAARESGDFTKADSLQNMLDSFDVIARTEIMDALTRADELQQWEGVALASHIDKQALFDELKRLQFAEAQKIADAEFGMDPDEAMNIAHRLTAYGEAARRVELGVEPGPYLAQMINKVALTSGDLAGAEAVQIGAYEDISQAVSELLGSPVFWTSEPVMPDTGGFLDALARVRAEGIDVPIDDLDETANYRLNQFLAAHDLPPEELTSATEVRWRLEQLRAEMFRTDIPVGLEVEGILNKMDADFTYLIEQRFDFLRDFAELPGDLNSPLLMPEEQIVGLLEDPGIDYPVAPDAAIDAPPPLPGGPEDPATSGLDPVTGGLDDPLKNGVDDFVPSELDDSVLGKLENPDIGELDEPIYEAIPEGYYSTLIDERPPPPLPPPRGSRPADASVGVDESLDAARLADLDMQLHQIVPEDALSPAGFDLDDAARLDKPPEDPHIYEPIPGWIGDIDVEGTGPVPQLDDHDYIWVWAPPIEGPDPDGYEYVEDGPRTLASANAYAQWYAESQTWPVVARSDPNVAAILDNTPEAEEAWQTFDAWVADRPWVDVDSRPAIPTPDDAQYDEFMGRYYQPIGDESLKVADGGDIGTPMGDLVSNQGQVELDIDGLERAGDVPTVELPPTQPDPTLSQPDLLFSSSADPVTLVDDDAGAAGRVLEVVEPESGAARIDLASPEGAMGGDPVAGAGAEGLSDADWDTRLGEFLERVEPSSSDPADWGGDQHRLAADPQGTFGGDAETVDDVYKEWLEDMSGITDQDPPPKPARRHPEVQSLEELEALGQTGNPPPVVPEVPPVDDTPLDPYRLGWKRPEPPPEVEGLDDVIPAVPPQVEGLDDAVPPPANPLNEQKTDELLTEWLARKQGAVEVGAPEEVRGYMDQAIADLMNGVDPRPGLEENAELLKAGGLADDGAGEGQAAMLLAMLREFDVYLDGADVQLTQQATWQGSLTEVLKAAGPEGEVAVFEDFYNPAVGNNHTMLPEFKKNDELPEGVRNYMSFDFDDVTQEYRQHGRAVSEKVQNIVSDIDTAAEPLTQDRYVYRGSYRPDYNYAVGDAREYICPKSCSTSIDKALTFAGSDTLTQIRLPEGMEAIVYNVDEAEILIPQGYAIRVTDVTPDVAFKWTDPASRFGMVEDAKLRQLVEAEIYKIEDVMDVGVHVTSPPPATS